MKSAIGRFQKCGMRQLFGIDRIICGPQITDFILRQDDRMIYLDSRMMLVVMMTRIMMNAMMMRKNHPNMKMIFLYGSQSS